MGRAVEGSGERGIGIGQQQQRGTAVRRGRAAGTDRRKDQVADGATVLRSGIAASGEVALDQRVGGRTPVACGGGDLVDQLDRGLGAGGGGHGRPSDAPRRRGRFRPAIFTFAGARTPSGSSRGGVVTGRSAGPAAIRVAVEETGAWVMAAALGRLWTKGTAA